MRNLLGCPLLIQLSIDFSIGLPIHPIDSY
jgi:hypothetical protein